MPNGRPNPRWREALKTTVASGESGHKETSARALLDPPTGAHEGARASSPPPEALKLPVPFDISLLRDLALASYHNVQRLRNLVPDELITSPGLFVLLSLRNQ